MSKRQLIRADQYDLLVDAAFRAMYHIEQRVGEFSGGQRKMVSNLFLKLVDEVLACYGPPLQDHRKGLENAFRRYATKKRTVGLPDHPKEPQFPELQPLAEQMEGEAPVEEGGEGDPPGPVGEVPGSTAEESSNGDSYPPEGSPG